MERLLVLLGPTAVGKTDLSLQVAETFGTHIVSADSRQFYGDLKIGTAPPTPAQLQQVPHHFVGMLALDAYYSAAQYETDCLALLQQLFANHSEVVLTGGSMLYIDAACKGIDDVPTIDADTRTLMQERLREEGLERLCAELKLVDPAYYRQADLKNPKRVVHALEVYYAAGRPYSSYHTHTPKERPFRIVKVGLDRPRSELFERINRRVDQMMEAGLLDEARVLYPRRHLNALNTVGYKELFRYLDGEWDLPFAVEKIKKNTRDYAKKQLTWFRRDPDIHWFHPDQAADILQFLKDA